MSAEDRLRDVLRSEATTIVPAGDGLAKIQQRLTRRRRRRVLLLPSAALATTAAVTAFLLIGGSDDTQQLVQTPASSGPSTSTSCHPQVPCPTPTPKATGTTAPVRPVVTYTGPALWPFTSAAQAQAWESHHGARPWADDPVRVAQHFATDFLGLQGVTSSGGSQLQGSGRTFSDLTLGGRVVGSLRLQQFRSGAGRPWTVTNAGGTDLTVTSPASGTGISSPTSVTGRITGVDENVSLRLITATGKQLATAGAPAGSAVPWQGTLTWSDSGWTTAGIVGTTYSAKDGALTRLVVVPVRRATGSSASGASFVALAGGHVNLYDSASGKQLRQLTFPPAGRYDTGATWSGSTLAWVRSQQTGCADALYRLENGSVTTIVKAGTAHLGTPQLSASGGWLAWLQTPCNGGATRVVVSGGGAPARTLPVGSGMTAAVLDVRDDGALLVHVNDAAATEPGTLGVVPGGALNLAGMKPLPPTASCYLAGGAAFDGSDPVAFETCLADSRLVRFTDQGARTSTGPTITGMAAPRSTTARAGHVLVWLRGGAVARYGGGRITTLVSSGVRAPDW